MQLSAITCNPDVLDFLMKREGGEWTGNTNCVELLRQERTLVDCNHFQFYQKQITDLIAWYSGILTAVSVFIFPLEDQSISRPRVIVFNVLMAVNAVLWYLYIFMKMYFQGYCNINPGAFSASITFYLLSLGTIVL